MSTNPNKLSKFWQELKRRKVIKVIAMYAGAAYVLIELANNVVEPLNLPDWTPRLVIIFVLVGFPIMLVLSWIFDITPEGMKRTEPLELINQQETVSVPAKRKLKVSDVIIAGLLIVVVVLAYPKVFGKDRLDQVKGADGKISLAVIPFQNMTNDTLWDVWELGIQNQLINNLSNTTSLSVRQLESVSGVLPTTGDFQHAALTPSMASSMSQKLNASVFIFGSIIKAGEGIRLNVQLTDARTDEIFRSFQLDSESESELLDVVDSLSLMLSNFLEVSAIDPGVTASKYISSTSISPEAVRYWAHGWNAYRNGDWPSACEWYLRSLEIDSINFIALWTIAATYWNRQMYEEGKKWCAKLENLREHMPLSMKQELMANWIYAVYYETPFEQVKWMKQSIELDDQDPGAYFMLGYSYMGLNQYPNAIPALEKALEIYDNWDVKPLFSANYWNLGVAYHHMGQYKKGKQLCKTASMYFPDDPGILALHALFALTDGDTVVAEGFIHDYVIINRDVWGNSDSEIHNQIGREIFSRAECFDRARKEYRQALALAPDDASILHNLALMLIDQDIDLNEGLKLVDRALELSPDHWSYLDTRGWGLYKQGKLNEALKILKQARDLQPIYFHDIYIHIQEVEKALSAQSG